MIRINSLHWNRSYVYLNGRLLATQKVGLPAADTTQFHHPDRLGTRLVTNGADGAVVSEQVGQPYGTMLANGVLHGEGSYQDPNANRSNQSQKRFTSYDRSATTGLDYAVNRFYNSAQGRFTQVDPIGMDAVDLGNPQTLNLYSYCGNDPINHVDPDGLLFGKLFGWIGSALKVIFRVAAVVLAVVAVLAVSWGFGALALKAAIGAGVFALMGWGSSQLGQAIGAAFFGGGYGSFRTPSTFPRSAGAGAVSNFLQQRSAPDKYITDKFKSLFNAAFTEAIKRLDKEKCAKLFGGKETALATLQSTEYRVLPFPSGGPKLDPNTGKYGVTGAQTNSPSSVFINEQGPFINQRLPVRGGYQTFDFGTGLRGKEFGALLLLHELGHQTKVFKPDASDSELNRRQTQKVIDACF